MLCGRKDRQTDMTKLIAVFRYFANSPKKQTDATLSQRCPFQLHAVVSVRNSTRTTLPTRSYDNNGRPSLTPRQCPTMDSPLSHPDSIQQCTALSHTQTMPNNAQLSLTPRQCPTMDSPLSHPDSAQQWTALSHTQTVANNGQPSLTHRQCPTIDSSLSHPDNAQQWTPLSHTQTVSNNAELSLTPRQCPTMDSPLSHPDSAQRASAVFDIAVRTVTASFRSTVRADNTLLPIP